MDDEKISMAFSNIKTYDGLKKNLIDKANRLSGRKGNNVRYLCHYTSLQAAVSIIKTKRWYLGSPLNMNDGLELAHAENEVWEKIFFASFMYEPQESIAMWSMYAQPWSDGIMIRIPVDVFKKWWKDGDHIISTADPKTKIDNSDNISASSKLSFHAVAYTNAESKKPMDEEELVCGDQKNSILKNVITDPKLVGYIKDCAWSYENEYRMRVDVDDSISCSGLSLSIPDEIVNAIEITAGPRFKGNLHSAVEKEIAAALNKGRISNSIFQGKLNWVYCDDCSYAKIK